MAKRSDMEYYSSLQTAASQLKLAYEDEVLTSNKTTMQRRQDKFEEQQNLQTQLGRQNKAEQLLASGFLATP